MERGFDLLKENKFNESANLFERIAIAEGNKWAPYYQAAWIKVISSFNMKDASKKQKQLEAAQGLVDSAFRLTGEDPTMTVETMILQALLHTSYITLDPSVYGMKLSGTVDSLYNKALEIAPENPRVLLSMAEWNMGAASFFGEDPSQYCKDVKKSLELFSNFKTQEQFYPSWGKSRAEDILATTCSDQ